jgi:hypothetical protein
VSRGNCGKDDCFQMTSLDLHVTIPGMDFQSLASLYRTKTDEELLQLAGQLSSLTAEARAVLSTELTSRRISPEAPLDTQAGTEQYDRDSVSKTETAQQQLHTGAFIAEVLQFYLRNRGLFIALVFPAVLLSTVAYLVRRHEVFEIGRHLPHGVAILEHKTEMLEIGLLSWGAFYSAGLSSASGSEQSVSLRSKLKRDSLRHSRSLTTLLSDPASRRRPCASLALHLHQVGQGTFTPKLSNMFGTQSKNPRLAQRACLRRNEYD